MAGPPIGTRGQTSIDVVVAIGVFMLVVALVFTFVPDMFTSFDQGQQRPLVADRAADRLQDGLLGNATAPSQLDATCTYAFFGVGTASDCGFDLSNDLPRRIGVGSDYRVNVTLERDVSADPGAEILCTDGTGVQACTSGGSRLAAGPSSPRDSGSVEVTHRTLYLDGQDVTLVVRVW
jgi:hypothetical protein